MKPIHGSSVATKLLLCKSSCCSNRATTMSVILCVQHGIATFSFSESPVVVHSAGLRARWLQVEHIQRPVVLSVERKEAECQGGHIGIRK